MQSTVSNSDVTERTDLRTLDAHYSAAEVYAAQWCPYPGAGPEAGTGGQP